MTTTPKNIGDTLTFTTPDNQPLTGVIETRNWAFEYVTSYVVRVGNLRYNVNTQGQSGHSF